MLLHFLSNWSLSSFSFFSSETFFFSIFFFFLVSSYLVYLFLFAMGWPPEIVKPQHDSPTDSKASRYLFRFQRSKNIIDLIRLRWYISKNKLNLKSVHTSVCPSIRLSVRPSIHICPEPYIGWLAGGGGWTNGQTDGQTHRFPLYSTGHRSLWGCCPMAVWK